MAEQKTPKEDTDQRDQRPHHLAITGGNTLSGDVWISGSKNAALPIMAAALLAPGKSYLYNVPQILDIATFVKIMTYLGVVTKQPNRPTMEYALSINASNLAAGEIPPALAQPIRASILLLGPLVARFGFAKIPFPRGCPIGIRNIDPHVNGFRNLGVEVSTVLESDGNCYIIGKAQQGGFRSGVVVKLDLPTVTGTENLMLLASLVPGITRLENAAREPEIADLAEVLRKMGASVEGAGTKTIVIHGKPRLQPFRHHIMVDRIECGTFLIAGALMGNCFTIRNGDIQHQEALIHLLHNIGARIEYSPEHSGIVIHRAVRPQGVDVQITPYPGIATDLQPQLTVLLATATQVSTITETVFESRFHHVPELNRMGADIRILGNKLVIQGVTGLSGAVLNAKDLRGNAALVLAALKAEGDSKVYPLHILHRGYEKMEYKLALAGASITVGEEFGK